MRRFERGRVSILVTAHARTYRSSGAKANVISSSPLGSGEIWDRLGRLEWSSPLIATNGSAPAGPFRLSPDDAIPSGIFGASHVRGSGHMERAGVARNPLRSGT